MTTSKIRVRFAPSPTGPLHIGNARAALFNWLFARHSGGLPAQEGEFLLRIEDTDKERSEKKYEKEILDGLLWLGLQWDGEIFRQSERLDLYQKNLEKLLAEKKAYYCFCTAEELETERQAQLSQGIAPKYSGKCRNLSQEDSITRLKKGEAATIRFRVPEKKISFTDIIRGKVEIDAALFGDIIIARSLEEPLYNFAAAVDDAEMEISHVIRGEDHLSNTPKQILIQEALGLKSPHFAHLPLILDAKRRKLSKRELETSLKDYIEAGYLPEAIFNFLTLLGWHPIEDREVVSRKEAIKDFTLERVQKGGGVFNLEKLNWLNAYYLKQTPPEKLADLLEPFVPKDWFKNKERLLKILAVEKDRLKTLKDFEELAGFFFELPDYDKNLLIWKETDPGKIVGNLKSVLAVLKESGNSPAGIPSVPLLFQGEIMALAEKEGRGQVLWPLRVALSGKEASPGPLEILAVLEQKETIKRLEKAIKKLES